MNPETPETNAAYEIAIQSSSHVGEILDDMVEFARKLELQKNQLKKACASYRSSIIIQNILAEGRPHGSNYYSAPDGCECDDCQNYDLLARLNEFPL